MSCNTHMVCCRKMYFVICHNKSCSSWNIFTVLFLKYFHQFVSKEKLTPKRGFNIEWKLYCLIISNDLMQESTTIKIKKNQPYAHREQCLSRNAELGNIVWLSLYHMAAEFGVCWLPHETMLEVWALGWTIHLLWQIVFDCPH